MDNQPDRVPMTKLPSQPAPPPVAVAPVVAPVVEAPAAIPEHIMAMQSHFKQIKVDLPPINFHKLKGYMEKEKQYKAELKTQMIVEHINEALKIYDMQETKYNTDVVLFVCQCVEDLISARKAGALKKDMVIKICAKYFDDKPELVETIIGLVFKDVIKTNFLRRHRIKIARISWYIAKNTLGAMFQSIIARPL